MEVWSCSLRRVCNYTMSMKACEVTFCESLFAGPWFLSLILTNSSCSGLMLSADVCNLYVCLGKERENRGNFRSLWWKPERVTLSHSSCIISLVVLTRDPNIRYLTTVHLSFFFYLEAVFMLVCIRRILNMAYRVVLYRFLEWNVVTMDLKEWPCQIKMPLFWKD